MSTSSKGKNFELRVLEHFQKWISEEQSPYRSDCCKLFHQHSYHSKDRGGPIKFDVVFEVRSPGRQEPTIINIIECKDLAAKVTIDDAEEFWSKLQQVGGIRCKGIIASTAGFQSSVLSFARSKGIGLIRFLQDDQVKWLLDRSPSIAGLGRSGSGSGLVKALTESDFESKWADVFAMAGTFFTDSLYQFFINHLSELESEPSIEIIAPKPLVVRVPFIDSSEIETCVNEIRNAINYKSGPVLLNNVCKWRENANGLRVVLEEAPLPKTGRNNVLGSIRFLPPAITLHLDPTSPRGRFTLAHELGHDILGHGQYLVAEAHDTADEIESSSTSIPLPTEIKRLEWQANYFASTLLLPTQGFTEAFFKVCRLLDLRSRGHGHMFVDDQPCNQASYHHALSLLASEFTVSQSVVKIRLKDLQLVKTQTELRKLAHDVQMRWNED